MKRISYMEFKEGEVYKEDSSDVIFRYLGREPLNKNILILEIIRDRIKSSEKWTRRVYEDHHTRRSEELFRGYTYDHLKYYNSPLYKVLNG